MAEPKHEINLIYEDTGGKKTPVVMIHAFPLSRAMWEPQLGLGSQARLIRYDVRGFGGSPVGDGIYGFEAFVDDLLGVLDHLDLKSAVLCGLSMGGYIALRAAERAPERVKALILADTKSEADGNEAKLKRADSAAAIKREGLEPFAEAFLKGVLAPSTFKDRPEVAELVRGLILQNDPKGVRAALLAMAGRTDTTAALPKLKVPALVLVGKDDALTPPSAAEALAKGLPQAKLEVLPKAGHLSNLENPQAFNKAVAAFLKKL